jgi:hypothetical protein
MSSRIASLQNAILGRFRFASIASRMLMATGFCEEKVKKDQQPGRFIFWFGSCGILSIF